LFEILKDIIPETCIIIRAEENVVYKKDVEQEDPPEKPKKGKSSTTNSTSGKSSTTNSTSGKSSTTNSTSGKSSSKSSTKNSTSGKKSKKSKDDDEEEEEVEIEIEETKPKKTKKTKKSKDDDEDDEIVVKRGNKKNNKNLNAESEVEDASGKKKVNASMRILTPTPDRNVLVNVVLDAGNFDVFFCRRSKLVIGLDLNNFYDYLRSVDNDDTITLYIDEDNTDVLTIKGISSKTNQEAEIEVNLMDLKETKAKLGPLDFDAMISMTSAKFHKLCKNFMATSQYLEIMSVGKDVRFTGKSEAGRITIKLKDSTEDEKRDMGVKNDGNKIVQGNYELKTLSTFSKCNSLCPIIEMYMKNEYPLVIKVSVASLGKAFFFCTQSKVGGSNN